MKNILYVEGSCAETAVSPMYKIEVSFNNTKVATKTQINKGKRTQIFAL